MKFKTADRLMYECLERGVSFKTSQGSFVPLSPRLTIERKDLERTLDILDEALGVVESEIV